MTLKKCVFVYIYIIYISILYIYIHVSKVLLIFTQKKTPMGLVRIGGAAMHHLRLAGLIVDDDGTVPGPRRRPWLDADGQNMVI